MSSSLTTRWSQVLAAGRPDAPEAGPALAELCQRYWPVVHAHIRRRIGHVAAVAFIAGGFWLGETQSHPVNKLLFRGGGVLLGMSFLVQNVAWQRRRSKWLLEDLEEAEPGTTAEKE